MKIYPDYKFLYLQLLLDYWRVSILLPPLLLPLPPLYLRHSLHLLLTAQDSTVTATETTILLLVPLHPPPPPPPPSSLQSIPLVQYQISDVGV